MKRGVKILLIVAACLVAVGVLATGAALALNGGAFTALNDGDYFTETYTVKEDFENLLFQTDTADLVLIPSQDGVCRVACYQTEKGRHTVSVQSGTLTVEAPKPERWLESFSLFSSGSPKITVYLPEAVYGTLTVREETGDVEIPADFTFDSLDVQASTGDVNCAAKVTGTAKIALSTGAIHLEGCAVGALDLSTSTGRIEARSVACAGAASVHVSTGKTTLTDLTCERLISDGSTGDLVLEDVLAETVIKVERSTGDVTFTRCDAAELTVKTDTGDVTGSLRSEKIFFAASDTGRVDVPKTVTGGKCEITTDTGDIQIRIA